MRDRSISALRTLRPEVDKGIFWFRDDLHQPMPISPMGMTTVQKHHAWGYHVAAKKTSLPPSKGAYVKIHKGRVYLGFALIHDEKLVAERAKEFGKFVQHCRENWNTFYNGYIDEVKVGLATMHDFDAASASWSALSKHVRTADDINRRNWEIHFILMYPADTLYLECEAYCQRLGLEEKDFVTILQGFDGMPAKTDAAIWKLALRAQELGLKDLFKNTSSEDLRAALATRAEAAPWLQEFNSFLEVYGNRINAAHLDVLFPTWKEDPNPVIDTIKSYFRRMEDGWDFYRAREAVYRERDKAIAAFEQKLDQKGLADFRRMLAIGQKVYAYQEDHGFYIDQGSTAALHEVLMGAGGRLQQVGLLERADDIFFLTFNELVEVLEDLSRDEEIAVYHHVALVPPLIDERKASWEEAKSDDAPLTLGNVPKTMTDPIAIKVFGIIDEVLHPKGEKIVAERLIGFAGSAGVAEGRARVVTDFEDFSTVQAGEILVAPYTGTAWTPLFLKIGGVVTDTGGMLTHAAIAAREYGIPAVVGTWNATNSIRNGDIIRIDGSAGVVEILQRAS
jgi:phosphohistidine swiveling domain-containing protein